MKSIRKFVASTLMTVAMASGALAGPGNANPAAGAGANDSISLTTEFGTSAVLAWSWGVSNSGTTHTGGGGGAGKANFQDMSITRHTDGQSPSFVMAVASGQILETVTLVRGLLKFDLEDVLVTSYSVGSSDGNKPTPQTENISLNFTKIKYTMGTTEFCYNAAQNTAC